MSHVRDHVQPGWPSHIRTNGESIFFGINSSPFASSRHLGEPLKGSAIQEGPTSNIFERGRDGQLNKSCTVHKGFHSNCMESRRKENFSEAGAVCKSEFLNFFNVGVKESTLSSSRQLSHACAPRVVKSFERAIFFHEYGRRVGMVPRSSLKEGKNNQMVEKRTKTTQQQTKPTKQPQTTAHRQRHEIWQVAFGCAAAHWLGRGVHLATTRLWAYWPVVGLALWSEMSSGGKCPLTGNVLWWVFPCLCTFRPSGRKRLLVGKVLWWELSSGGACPTCFPTLLYLPNCPLQKLHTVLFPPLLFHKFFLSDHSCFTRVYFTQFSSHHSCSWVGMMPLTSRPVWAWCLLHWLDAFSLEWSVSFIALTSCGVGLVPHFLLGGLALDTKTRRPAWRFFARVEAAGLALRKA